MRQLLRLSLDENPFQDDEVAQRIRSEGALSVCLSSLNQESYVHSEYHRTTPNINTELIHQA